MAEITLLRHGQASFGSDDYDHLSSTGRQQSIWFGEHQKELGQRFDRIVCGTMNRHIQTAQSILNGLGEDHKVETHKGFNEYNFSGLLAKLRADYSQSWSESGHAARDYHQNIRRALELWMSGDIATDNIDTWQTFCFRTQQAFDLLTDSASDNKAKRTLVVTSGGPISVVLGSILQLDNPRIIDVSLQIKNTSVHKILFSGSKVTLDSFNDMSHLNQSARLQQITFT